MRLFLLCVGITLACSAGWAVDESITPTEAKPIAGLSAEESAKVAAYSDKEFNDAMSIWFKHKYKDGAKLLAEFAAKHPDSRWRAEAEMHRGCYLTYPGRVGDGAAREAGLG